MSRRPLPTTALERAASDRYLAAFHLGFLLFAVAALTAARDGREGWAVLAIGIAYNLALPISAVRWVQPQWVRLWGFLLPLSFAQILPDWVLVHHVGSLVFPDLGGVPRLGDAVPVYMALLWVAALLPILYLGDRVAETTDWKLALVAVGLASLVVFASAEALLTTWVPLWQAVDVKTIGPVALYVLPAEVLLGMVAFFLWHEHGHRILPLRILAALATMFAYLGALTFFHRLIEGM